MADEKFIDKEYLEDSIEQYDEKVIEPIRTYVTNGSGGGIKAYLWDTTSSGGQCPRFNGSASGSNVTVSITKPSNAYIMVVEYAKADSTAVLMNIIDDTSHTLTDLGLTTSNNVYLKITIATGITDGYKTYKPFIVSLEWNSSLGVVPGWYN